MIVDILPNHRTWILPKDVENGTAFRASQRLEHGIYLSLAVGRAIVGLWRCSRRGGWLGYLHRICTTSRTYVLTDTFY